MEPTTPGLHSTSSSRASSYVGVYRASIPTKGVFRLQFGDTDSVRDCDPMAMFEEEPRMSWLSLLGPTRCQRVVSGFPYTGDRRRPRSTPATLPSYVLARDASLDAVQRVLGADSGPLVKAGMRLMALAGGVNEHELRCVLQLDASDAGQLFDRLREARVVTLSAAGLALHPILCAAVRTDLLLRDPFAARDLVERLLDPLEAALAWPGAPRARAQTQLAALLAAAPVDPTLGSHPPSLVEVRRASPLDASDPGAPAVTEQRDAAPDVTEVRQAFRNLNDLLWLSRSRLAELLFGELPEQARGERLRVWLEQGIRAAGATRCGDRVERAMRASFVGGRSNDEAADVAGMSLATLKRHRRAGVAYVHQLLLRELASVGRG